MKTKTSGYCISAESLGILPCETKGIDSVLQSAVSHWKNLGSFPISL